MSDAVALPSTLRWTEASFFWPEKPEWMALGSCRGCDPDLWYAERGESTAQAKEICAACPVRGECLDYALANRELYGVWGGCSERERRRLRVRDGSKPDGRPSPVAAARRRQVREMRAEGLRPAEIARSLGLTTRTVHRYLEEVS